jgi:hypothetical protein
MAFFSAEKEVRVEKNSYIQDMRCGRHGSSWNTVWRMAKHNRNAVAVGRVQKFQIPVSKLPLGLTSSLNGPKAENMIRSL